MSNVEKTVKGHVRPRPSKENTRYYDVVLDFGKNQYTGKRERITFHAETTNKKEAENMLTVKKAEYLQGTIVEPTKLLVKDYLDEYLETYVKPLSSPATVKDYRTMIESYIKPTFGDIKLQDLTNMRIQQVYNSWKRKSPKGGNPLRTTTILHINRVLKASLNVAIDIGYIKENPARKIRVGKDNETKEMDVYTTEEILKLQQAVKGTDMQLPVALLIDGVMRRGELLGLRYDDIDFEKKTIHIQHAWVEGDIGEQPELKDCKSTCSNRKIVVSDYTIQLLKKAKLVYMQNRMKYGNEFRDDKFVICKENGEPYLPKSMTHKWSKTLKRYNLRHIKLHGMRHSAISYLLSEGIPLHIVQQRAGHKDPKITLETYSHVAKDKQSIVAEKLDECIFKVANM